MGQEQMVSAVLQAVQALPQSRQPLIVALDGRCASGKTTLAALLQQRTGCSVVHMDHFFLRPEQRTRERLEQPGGNVDYERFLAEVLEPLRAGKDCSYRPYDCKQQKLAEAEKLAAGHQAQLDKLEDELRERRAESQKIAQAAAQQQLDRAQEQADQIIAAARKSAQSIREKAVTDSRKELKELAMAAAEKLALSSSRDAFDEFLNLAEEGKQHEQHE